MFFGLFLWLILAIAALLCVIWLGSLIFFIVGYRQRARTKMWVSGTIFVLISIFGGMNYLAFHTRPNPTYAYKNAFGAPPSNDVSELRLSDDTFGDYSVIYLKFKASSATIQRLTAKGFGKGLTGEDLVGENSNWDSNGFYYHGKDTPDWWRPQRTATTRVFYAEKRLGHFNTQENETLIYDPATHQAYYSYDGLD